LPTAEYQDYGCAAVKGSWVHTHAHAHAVLPQLASLLLRPLLVLYRLRLVPGDVDSTIATGVRDKKVNHVADCCCDCAAQLLAWPSPQKPLAAEHPSSPPSAHEP